MHRRPTDPELPSTAELLLPYLDAAYNLARWLVRNDHDAEDVVQEAFMRASRYGCRGGLHNPRAWLFAIVRNTSYEWLRRRRSEKRFEPLDEDRPADLDPRDPERDAVLRLDVRLLHAALTDLPPRFREVLVLREIEGLSYKEMAGVLDVPLGTVMSTLSRARARLRSALRTTTGAARDARDRATHALDVTGFEARR